MRAGTAHGAIRCSSNQFAIYEPHCPRHVSRHHLACRDVALDHPAMLHLGKLHEAGGDGVAAEQRFVRAAWLAPLVVVARGEHQGCALRMEAL